MKQLLINSFNKKIVSLFALLVTIIFVSGCTNTQKEEIEKTALLKNENNFQIICDAYNEYITKKIKKDDYDGQGTFGAIDYEKYESNLINIFYSPKLNTCITHYSDFSHMTGFNNFSGEIDQKEIYEVLFDIFTDKKIASSKVNEEYFQKKLTELNVPENQNYEGFIERHNKKQSEIKEEEENLTIRKEDIFKKNQECAKWLPKIREREEEYRKVSPRWQAQAQEIFYSPKTNSCLYITHVQYSYFGEEPAFTLKTLMDISYEIGVNPVDDMSCEFISNYIEYNKMRDYSEKQGAEKLKRFNDSEKRRARECARFDKEIKDEYKN